MNTKAQIKALSKKLIKNLGYPASTVRQRRMHFLVTAFEIMEQDPKAQLFLTGRHALTVDADIKRINSHCH